MSEVRTFSPYIEQARKSIEWWENKGSQHADSYERALAVDMVANAFFYLGYTIKAREISNLYSKDQERIGEKNAGTVYEAWYLFNAALYRSLAMRHEEARLLWQRLVVAHDHLLDEKFLDRKLGNSFVHLAYAMAKLGRYKEVFVPAAKGYEAMSRGLGIADVGRMNAPEYVLVDVLKALASYYTKPAAEGKQQAQEALARYKQENYELNRLGYPIIFDLQFSYPDLFKPVLPGPDPQRD